MSSADVVAKNKNRKKANQAKSDKENTVLNRVTADKVSTLEKTGDGGGVIPGLDEEKIIHS